MGGGASKGGGSGSVSGVLRLEEFTYLRGGKPISKSDTHAKVFLGLNRESGEVVAVKVTASNSETSLQTHKEAAILRLLQHSEVKVAPVIYTEGTVQEMNLIFMEQLGPSLSDVLAMCNAGKPASKPRTFSLATTCVLAYELLEALKILSKSGIVHGDLRPGNVLLGTDPESRNLYFCGFSHAQRLFDENSLKHVALGRTPMQPKLMASPFASRSVYRGDTLSRRDDLESVGLILVYFLRGSLPFCDKPELPIQLDVNNKGPMVQAKLALSDVVLCKGLPTQFKIYFEYVRKLGFREEPNYTLLQDLFVSCVPSNGNYPGPALSLVIPDWVVVTKARIDTERRKSFMISQRAYFPESELKRTVDGAGAGAGASSPNGAASGPGGGGMAAKPKPRSPLSIPPGGGGGGGNGGGGGGASGSGVSGSSNPISPRSLPTSPLAR